MACLIRWSEATYIEKVTSWRDLRVEILEVDYLDALNLVAMFWSKIPYANSKLDLYSPNTWPIAWEILGLNDICSDMISIMIFLTFKHAMPDIKVDLRIVCENNVNFLVAVVDDYCVFNYEMGTVINSAERDFNFVHTYTEI